MAKTCWEEMRRRVREGRKKSSWEEERRFFEEREFEEKDAERGDRFLVWRVDKGKGKKIEGGEVEQDFGFEVQ